MDISLGWIKEFVEIPDLPADECGRLFTLATAEVEGVKERGKNYDGILIAEVKEVIKHPEADKLSVCKVDTGTGALFEVACGAPNVRAGLKVAYAPVGFTMPNGLTLEPRKIRGIVSNGMLCSQAELEVGDNHEGIWELPEDSPLGKSLVEVFPQIQDVIIDIDNKSLTHRPDLWAHVGLAREWAAIQRKKFKYPYTEEWIEGLRSKFSDEDSPIQIKVEKDTASLGYFGLSVDNIKVQPSPIWMQLRLLSVGLRPINNIVDISNYVMLETGMPNHIFDLNRIKGSEIIIRTAKDGEQLEMLDGSIVSLTPSDTVVADIETALVVGGVMGGKDSGVSEETTRIFVECANWTAAKIRRTSTRIGLRTDSSLRYEKSLDSNLLERTLLRILELVCELNPEARVIGQLEYDGPAITGEEKSVVVTSYKRICRLLGTEISDQDIREILECLDFEVKEETDKITVIAPTYRSTKDIECEYCLVEEVGRMIGYDNIAPESPYFQIKPALLSSEKIYQRKIQDFMSLTMPAYEVITYALVGEEFLERASWPNLNERMVLGNPFSNGYDRMRPALIPSLLNVAALNAKTYSSFKMFETSRVYLLNDDNEVTEPNHLGIVSYSRDGAGLIIDILNAIEGLGSYIGVDWQVRDWKGEDSDIIPADWKGWHPYQSSLIEYEGQIIGGVTKVNPRVLSEYKLKGEIVIAEINLSVFDTKEQKNMYLYKAFGRHPSSDFDCTVLADVRTPAERIVNVVLAENIENLTSVKVVTVFDMHDKKAVTLKSLLSSANKTLSPDEIKRCEERIIDSLNRAGFPLRS